MMVKYPKTGGLKKYKTLTEDELREVVIAFECVRKLAAVIRWIEINQPDAFKRGLWDAVNDAAKEIV
jgi:hypothetical protein